MSLYDALVVASKRLCEGGPELITTILGSPRFLGEPRESHLYRIALESITNAKRHADCTRLNLELRYESNSFRLIVKDDGKGFVFPVLDEPLLTHHWGLIGMQERAKQCEGQLTITSAPGKGTEIRIDVDLGGET